MKRPAARIESLNRRPRIIIIGTLFLAATLFFLWRLGGDVTAFVYRPGARVSDLTVTFWPNIHYIRDSWRVHRQIPLWRTLIFSGSPFDADPQSGLWYPPNLIFTLLPTAVGFNLLFVLHTVWAGLGMWSWSRATGTSSASSLLAALAYAFTPKTFAHLGFGHAGLVYAAAWIPWILWAVHRIGRGSRCHLAVLGLALGLQTVAHPQLAFYTGLLAAGYGLITVFSAAQSSEPPSSLCRLTWLFLGALLALGLAAGQLLPLVHFAPQTARASMSFSETAVSSLPPRYLVGLILADHRGFMDYALYVGIPVLALALLALRRRRARFWWTLVCVALLYALGTHTPVYRWGFRLLPGLSWLRAPTRVWFLSAAALALLAGWGTDHLIGGMQLPGWRWIHRFAVAFGLLAPALLAGYALTVGQPPANLVAFGLVTPATAALCVAAARGHISRRAIVPGFALVLLADLWVVDASLVVGRPRHAVFAGDVAAAYLARQSDQQPFRVYSPSYSLPRHVAVRYRLEAADGVDPLYLEDYATWMAAASGVQREGYTETVPTLEGGNTIATANQEAVPDTRMLGLLNVRYVASEFPIVSDALHRIGRFDSTYLYENEHFLPRAFVVGRVEPVDDFSEALAWVQTHDVAQAAAVEDGPPLASGDPEARVVWTHRSPNRLELDVTLDRPGFFLLSQPWYPGWHARIDREPVSLWKADGVLSGIYLEPGRHEISFTYRPRWTLVGAAVSIASVAAIAAIAVNSPQTEKPRCK